MNKLLIFTSLIDTPISWTTNRLSVLFVLSVIVSCRVVPFCAIIILANLQSIPKELYEAAKIDGGSEKDIFLKIVLPLSYPIIITCILTMFLMSLNQFQIPLILTSSQDKKVITLILSEFMSRDAISYGLIAVCGVVSIIPPAIVAILFRKFLVTGLTSGSTKG